MTKTKTKQDTDKKKPAAVKAQKIQHFFLPKKKKQWLRDRMMMMMVEKRILQSKLNC